MTPSSVSEWREQYPDFSQSLDCAEAEYVASLTASLRDECRTKWNTPDPKALELLSRRFVEFRQHQEIETKSVSVTIGVQVAPDQLSALQAMWRQSLDAK